GATRPARVERNELAGCEDEVVGGVWVVGCPDPDAERDAAGAELGLERGRRGPCQHDVEPGFPEGGLDLLRERGERDAVDREVTRILERHTLRSDAGSSKLGPGPREVALDGAALRQGAEDHRCDDPGGPDRALPGDRADRVVVEGIANRLL